MDYKQKPFTINPFKYVCTHSGKNLFLQANGTLIKYTPVIGTEVIVKDGTLKSINNKYLCITCMKEYENKSLEELRLEDYEAGRKGNANAGGMSGAPKPTFFEGSGTHSGKNLSLQANGTLVKYTPVIGTEVIVKDGTLKSINNKFLCITCMKEYENKSLEELRLEDYEAGRKGNANAGGMFGATKPTSFEESGTHSGKNLFLQANGTLVKYSPVIGTEVTDKDGTSQSINIKHLCITCMKEYENKSLEELRLEDYEAGRKGNANAEGILKATKPILFEGSGLIGASTRAISRPRRPLRRVTNPSGSTASASTSSALGASTSGGFVFDGTANTSGGLFGANKPSFGAKPSATFGQTATTTTTSSLFGQLATTTTSSMFGQLATTTTSSLFGQLATTTASSVFGQPVMTTIPSLFGQPLTTTTSSVFGQPAATTTSSAFSQPVTTMTSSVIDQPATTTNSTVFDQPAATTTSSVFSQPMTMKPSVIDQPAMTTNSIVFDQPAATTTSSAFSQPVTTTTPSLFGQPVTMKPSVIGPSAATTISSTFSQTVTTTITSLFGQPVTMKPSVIDQLAMTTNSIVFDQPAATTTSSAFSQPVTTTTPSLFGQLVTMKPSVIGPSAATTTSSAFSQPVTTTTPSLFGQPVTMKPSVIGPSAATTTSSAFSQPVTMKTSSVFGQPVTMKPSVIDQPATTTNSTVFGQPAATATSSAFSQPVTTTTSSVFGQLMTIKSSAIDQLAITTNSTVYGQPAVTTTSSAFSQPVTTTTSSVFGQPMTIKLNAIDQLAMTTSSAFSQPVTTTTPSLFGQPVTMKPSVIGPSAATTTSSAFSQPVTTTTSSVFGQPVTMKLSVIDQPATTMNSTVFGQPAVTATSSAFSQPITTTTSNVFGQPMTIKPNAIDQLAMTTSSAFSQPVTTTTPSLFGQPVTMKPSVIGPSAATTTSSAFSQPVTTTTSSVFGQPVTMKPSVIDQPATTMNSTVFGHPAVTATSSEFSRPVITTPSSVFGQPAATTNSSPFSQQVTTTNSSVFGQLVKMKPSVIDQPAKTTNSTVYGQPAATATSSAFSRPETTTNSSVFGQPVTTTTSSVFGQPAATTNSSPFSQQVTTTNSSVFGQPVTTTSSSMFGQPVTMTTPSLLTTTTSSVLRQPVKTTASSVVGQPVTTTTSSVFNEPATMTTSSMFSQQVSTTTSNIFEQPVTMKPFSTFGQPVTITTSCMFSLPARTTSFSMFGQPVTTTTSSIFGKPVTMKTSSLFGEPATITNCSTIGQRASTTNSNMFGQPVMTTSFSMFGQPVTMTTSTRFGQPATTTTPSMFGQPSTMTTCSIFGQSVTTTTSSIFGQLSTTTTTSIFGQLMPTTTSNILSQSTATTTPSMFSQPATMTTSIIFGQPVIKTAPSMFGRPMTTTTSSMVGLPVTTMSSSISTGFGQPVTTTTSSIFGQLATTTSSVLGQPATTTTPSVLGGGGLGSTRSFGQTPMGQRTPRTTCTVGTPTNLPPLSFHRVHGEGVRISEDGSTASMVQTVYGLTFSARPVRVNEKVCIRFLEISNQICFISHLVGFVAYDPANLTPSALDSAFSLPRITGTSIRRLEKKFCEKDNIFYYYVNSAGEIHFGINGEDKGILIYDVDTRSPLWSVMEFSGVGTVVQYVDPEALNQIRRSLPSSLSEGNEGLDASRTTCTVGTPDNLPPLSFHPVHGENLSLSEDGSTVRRDRENTAFGLAFSARPVRVNERVCIRFVETSNRLSEVLIFGFTCNDPAIVLSACLPKDWFVLREFRSSIWGKSLEERFCKKDNILYYYVNSAGEVHFGINGEDKGIFFTGVDTKRPLWSIVNVQGVRTAIQYVNSRALTQIHRSLPSSLFEDSEERLPSSLRTLSIDESLPPPRFQSQAVVPSTLHITKGRNIQYISDRGVAARDESEICQGYVFTATPMRLGQTLVIQILATEPAYTGSLAIGLTSCDPATLIPSDLPDDPEQLLDRPEYWVVKKDSANGLRRGDELAVTLTLDGEVKVSKNGSNPMTVMHVDQTVSLFAFVDIYGATQKVRMLSSQLPHQVQTLPPAQQSRVLTDSTTPINNGAGSQQPFLQDVMTQPSSSRLQAPPHQQPGPQQRRSNDTSCSSNQNSQHEQVILPNIVPIELSDSPLPSDNERLANNLTSTECTICCENPINSVLYTCGHMCMCYLCALDQWQGRGSGQCPLCRANIDDVIRTYKS